MKAVIGSWVAIGILAFLFFRFPAPIIGRPSIVQVILFLLIAGAAVPLWAYVLGPMALHRDSRVDTQRRVRTMTPDDVARADADLLAFVAHNEAMLEYAGFGAPHRIVAMDTPKMFSFASLLEHRDNGDIATVMAIRSTTAGARAVAAITLAGDVAGRLRVITTNVSSVRRFPQRPQQDVARLPAVSDPAELYAIHRFRVAGHSGPATTRLTRGDTEEARLAFQDAEAAEGYAFWVSRGYYHPTPTELRLTWKGAICAAWRGFFPWRQLTEWRANRKAARILASMPA